VPVALSELAGIVGLGTVVPALPEPVRLTSS